MEPVGKGPIRVMLVDDHRLLREGLRRILELEPDLQVVGEAQDGREAVELALKLRPEVILMDISMPGINGLEATRLLRARMGDVNVIALTIHADDQYVVEMVRAGARGYLLKDADPATVVEAIRRVHDGGACIPPDLLRSLVDAFTSSSGAEGARAQGAPAALAAQPAAMAPAYPLPGSAGPALKGPQQGEHLRASATSAAASAPSSFPQPSEPLSRRELEVLEQVVAGRTNKEIGAVLYISEKTVKNHITNLLRKLKLADRTQAAVYALRTGLIRLDPPD